MAHKYILAIDSGTTSTRAILFNVDGTIECKAERQLKCYYPKPGWVEQDPIEIWLNVLDTINECLARIEPDSDDIIGVGITNQRETTIVFDKKTGKPVYPAIVWQSKETTSICDNYQASEEMIRLKTGLKLNPYFSASKIRFILDKNNNQKRAENGELLFATVDTWLIYKLTKGQTFATDYSNASRTLLFNIFDLKWDEELLKLFNIPSSMLPKVLNSTDNYGMTSIPNLEVPIYGVAGDQQASLFGHACFQEGSIKNTYGTGLFMLMNIGTSPVLSNHGLLTTIAWSIDNKVTYALEGSVFIGGAAVKWMLEELRIIETPGESETYATKVSDEGVYIVPAFVGLGTPYWDSKARGAIFGITRGTSREHIIRATLESIAYQSRDVIEMMKKEAHKKIRTLMVDGGATVNNFLMQFQADILGVKLVKPEIIETTALGAYYLAALGSGYYKTIDDIQKIHRVKEEFVPEMNSDVRKELYKKWKVAIKATRVFK